jgi:hypothetical protein
MFYAYYWDGFDWVLCGASFYLADLEARCEALGLIYATIGGW